MTGHINGGLVVIGVVHCLACGGAKDRSSQVNASDQNTTATKTIELGVRHYEGVNRTVDDLLAEPSRFLQHLKDKSYEGHALARVWSDHDIVNVERATPEHILRMTADDDREVSSSWRSLRSSGSVFTDGRYAVDLVFEAKISDSPEAGNGALELRANATRLSLEWEYPSTGERHEVTVELAAPSAH